MRTDLEVLNSVDHIIIKTSTSDSECVSEAEEQMLNPKRRTTCGLKRGKERQNGRQGEKQRVSK